MVMSREFVVNVEVSVQRQSVWVERGTMEGAGVVVAGSGGSIVK